MAEMKPAVKDISINLINAPRELLLGTKSYELNFNIMNLRSEEKEVSVEFSSDGLSVDPPVSEITLAPQEKQTIMVSVTPQQDGALDLSVKVNLKKIVKYTETVLEGQEGVQEEGTVVKTSAPAPTLEIEAVDEGAQAQPSKPVKAAPGAKPMKPAGAAKPMKPTAAAKPAIGKPMKPAGAGKPMKPAGAAKPMKPVKRVKSAGAAQPAAEETPSADNEALERKIME